MSKWSENFQDHQTSKTTQNWRCVYSQVVDQAQVDQALTANYAYATVRHNLLATPTQYAQQLDRRPHIMSTLGSDTINVMLCLLFLSLQTAYRQPIIVPVSQILLSNTSSITCFQPHCSVTAAKACN